MDSQVKKTKYVDEELLDWLENQSDVIHVIESLCTIVQSILTRNEAAGATDLLRKQVLEYLGSRRNIAENVNSTQVSEQDADKYNVSWDTIGSRRNKKEDYN